MFALVLLAALAGTTGVLLIKHLPEAALGEAEAAAPVAARPQEIQSVAFDGRDLPVAALRGALTTKVGEQLHRDSLGRDRDALLATLHARGYLAAEVATPTVRFDASGGAYVTFAVTAGPRFHVRSVAVAGVDARDLGGVVTLVAGDDAIPDRIERTRQSIADYLARHGKAAKLATRLTLDPATSSVDVVLAAS